MRLCIEYYDQNESFAKVLPREGVVQATPTCSDSSHNWYLLRLDDPLMFEGAEYSHFLVASRWQGDSVGGWLPTSVFILLVPTHSTVADGFSHKQFFHVAWGMSSVVRTKWRKAISMGVALFRRIP